VAGSGYGLAVNAKTSNPAAAKAFLNTAATVQSQTELNSAIGGLPILPAGPTAVPAPFAGWVSIIRSGRAVPMFDQYWDNAEVLKALTTGTIELMTGQTTIPQVLANMDDAYNAGAT
jgi:raffinose/stachyose/melibiose transport system substrate-binding protein